MALTRIQSIGIATGISLTGVTTTQDAKIGTGITLSPDGDIYATGIITATSYRGDVSNCTGVGATNFVNTQSIYVSGITSVGAGITLSPDGDIFATGVCTATSFKGDGSNLTGIDATQILTLNTSVQTTDTGSNGTVKVTTDGTEALRVDSSQNVLIGDTAGAVGKLSTLGTGNHISASRHSTDTSASNFIFAKYRGSRSSPSVVANGDDLGNLMWYGYNGSSIIKGADITAKTNGTVDGSNMTTDLVFSTTTGNTNTERLRITSAGDIEIGTQSAHSNTIKFADSTRDDAVTMKLDNSDDSDFDIVNNRSGADITIATNSAERLRITSAGVVHIGNTFSAHSEGDDLVIGGSGWRGMTIYGEGGGGVIQFADDGDNRIGQIMYNHSDNSMFFRVNGNQTRLKINSSGNVMIGDTDTDNAVADSDNLVIGAASGDNGMTIVSQSGNYNGTIRFSDGANSGSDAIRGVIQYYHGENYLRFYTNAAEKLRIQSDGTLIHTNNINGQAIHQFRNQDVTSGSSAMTQELHFNFARTGTPTMNLSAARIIAGKEQEWTGAATNQNGYLVFQTCLNESPTEKMRLSSGGNLMIGTTTASEGANTDEGVAILPYGSIVCRRDSTMYVAKSIATGGYTALKILSAQTQVGSISFNSGGSSFNTSSDYRRKENVIDLTGAIARLKTLKPKRFNFISNPSVTLDGFLAHEVTAVPEAVTGTKDAVEPKDDEEREVKKDDPIYQQLDQSKLVPLLTAALQEAITEIETLKTKVSALESA